MICACRIHDVVDIGKNILKQLLQLEPHSSRSMCFSQNIFCGVQNGMMCRGHGNQLKMARVLKGRAMSFIEMDSGGYVLTGDESPERDGSFMLYI